MSSTVNIKSVQEPDRASLEKRIGSYNIYVGCLNEAMFTPTVKYMKEQILSNLYLPETEKEKRIAYLESLQWQPSKFYWWTLRYRQQFSRKPNDITLTIVDARGNKAGAPIFYENVKKSESDRKSVV